ncbi:MAG: cytochrome B [Balneolales bacterium]|nr:cytochrome B [Balneolales bacterium]
MYIGFQHLHSYLSYLVLAGLVISIVLALKGFFGKNQFTDKDRKLALLGLIPVHLQWVFGLVLYFLSPLGLTSLSGDVMGNSVARLYAIEHPLTMIIAVILITVGFSKAKRASDPQKQYVYIWTFYLAGLLLILLRIPWINWP